MKHVQWPVFAALLWGAGLTGCDRTIEGETKPAGDEPSVLERRLDSAQVERGRIVYEKNCQVCHGHQGKGLPGDWRVRDADGFYPPPPLDDSAHAWHHPTAVLLEVIRDGSPAGEGKMPAWQGTLTEQDMQDVVVYIKSLWSDPVYRLWLKMERQSLEP